MSVGFDPLDSASVVTYLEQWSIAYRTNLAPKLQLGAFRGEGPPDTKGFEAWISGEALAPGMVRPDSAVLYVRDLAPQMIAQNRWRTDGHHNIVVRRKFWGSEGIGGLWNDDLVAPWPIVYSDMTAVDDPRVRNAAIEWRESNVQRLQQKLQF
jgi:hypothetical protein